MEWRLFILRAHEYCCVKLAINGTVERINYKMSHSPNKQQVCRKQNRADCKQPYTILNTVYAVRNGIRSAKIAATVAAACNGLENSSVQAETSGDSGKVIFSLMPQGKL